MGLGWGHEDLRRPPRRNRMWLGLLRMRRKNGISCVSDLRRSLLEEQDHVLAVG